MELIPMLRWNVLVNLLAIFFPNGGNSSFLRIPFKKVLTGGMDIEVYKTHSNVRSELECAQLWNRARGEDYKSEAFRFDDREKKCELYSDETDELTPHPGVEIFLFELRSVFHLIQLNGKQYSVYMSQNSLNFTDARTHCNKLGGYLLEFDSLDEYEAVKLVSKNYIRIIFVGANDMEDNGQWVTDRERLPLDTDKWIWMGGRPNQSPSGGHCAVTYSDDDYRLLDWDCDDEMTFFCENDIP